MLLPASFSAALALMLLSMVCWGSWPNAYRLAPRRALEFRHFDFSIGLLVAALIALVVGNAGVGLRSADPIAFVAAAAGGVVVNIGNYLLMAGVARVGLAIAFPVSVGSSLVVSALLSYLVRPLGDPLLLGAGVALVFAAVMTNSLAYRCMGARSRGDSHGGLPMCFGAAVFFSVSGPLVAKALTTPRPLDPYAVSLVYAAGSMLAAVLVVQFVGRPPWAGYVSRSVRDHAAGLTGGLIWGCGMVLNFLAAGMVGMAVAGAIGQANPLVAALWGIFVWREFRGASRRVHLLLAVMIVLYAAGLVLVGESFPRP